MPTQPTRGGIPVTLEACIDVVRAQILREDAAHELPEAELTQLATREVTQLWQRPIKQFIPLLATRAVREQLVSKAPITSQPVIHVNPSPTTGALAAYDLPRTTGSSGPNGRDEDALIYDERDTMLLD